MYGVAPPGAAEPAILAFNAVASQIWTQRDAHVEAIHRRTTVLRAWYHAYDRYIETGLAATAARDQRDEERALMVASATAMEEARMAVATDVGHGTYGSHTDMVGAHGRYDGTGDGFIRHNGTGHRELHEKVAAVLAFEDRVVSQLVRRLEPIPPRLAAATLPYSSQELIAMPLEMQDPTIHSDGVRLARGVLLGQYDLTKVVAKDETEQAAIDEAEALLQLGPITLPIDAETLALLKAHDADITNLIQWFEATHRSTVSPLIALMGHLYTMDWYLRMSIGPEEWAEVVAARNVMLAAGDGLSRVFFGCEALGEALWRNAQEDARTLTTEFYAGTKLLADPTYMQEKTKKMQGWLTEQAEYNLKLVADALARSAPSVAADGDLATLRTSASAMGNALWLINHGKPRALQDVISSLLGQGYLMKMEPWDVDARTRLFYDMGMRLRGAEAVRSNGAKLRECWIYSAACVLVDEKRSSGKTYWVENLAGWPAPPPGGEWYDHSSSFVSKSQGDPYAQACAYVAAERMRSQYENEDALLANLLEVAGQITGEEGFIAVSPGSGGTYASNVVATLSASLRTFIAANVHLPEFPKEHGGTTRVVEKFYLEDLLPSNWDPPQPPYGPSFKEAWTDVVVLRGRTSTPAGGNGIAALLATLGGRRDAANVATAVAMRLAFRDIPEVVERHFFPAPVPIYVEYPEKGYEDGWRRSSTGPPMAVGVRPEKFRQNPMSNAAPAVGDHGGVTAAMETATRANRSSHDPMSVAVAVGVPAGEGPLDITGTVTDLTKSVEFEDWLARLPSHVERVDVYIQGTARLGKLVFSVPWSNAKDVRDGITARLLASSLDPTSVVTYHMVAVSSEDSPSILLRMTGTVDELQGRVRAWLNRPREDAGKRLMAPAALRVAIEPQAEGAPKPPARLYPWLGDGDGDRLAGVIGDWVKELGGVRSVVLQLRMVPTKPMGMGAKEWAVAGKEPLKLLKQTPADLGSSKDLQDWLIELARQEQPIGDIHVTVDLPPLDTPMQPPNSKVFKWANVADMQRRIQQHFEGTHGRDSKGNYTLTALAAGRELRLPTDSKQAFSVEALGGGLVRLTIGSAGRRGQLGAGWRDSDR